MCRRYKEQLSLAQLSGVGLQLDPSAEDPDRPCTVTCQDRDAALRFYRVKGRDGWFPSGLDCSRGEPGRTAYCLSGKCVDFGEDGTPLHDARYDYAFLFESSFRYHRVTRDAAPAAGESTRQEAPLSRPGATRIRGSVDREFIQRVIGDLQRDEKPAGNISAADIDLRNPLLLASLPPEASRSGQAENELSHAFALVEPALQVAEGGEAVGEQDVTPAAAVSEVREEDGEQAPRTAAETATALEKSAGSQTRRALHWTGAIPLLLTAIRLR